MTKKQLAILDSEYRLACVNYACAFAKKQGIEFDGFLNDATCNTVMFGDYYFDLSDIIFDLQNTQPKGLILRWKNDSIEAYFAGNFDTINYRSYCDGHRYQKK